MTKQKSDLKDEIRSLMEGQENTRNSDHELIKAYMIKHYASLCCKDFVSALNMMKDLGISFEGITRMRRKVQEENPTLAPTDFNVAMARGWEEIAWKKALGYYTEEKEQLFLF